MTKKKKRGRRKSPVPVLISLIVIVLIVIVIALFFNKYTGTEERMSANEYFGISSDTEAALIVNGQKLEEKGIVSDGRIYIDISTAWSYFSSGFYYNSDSGTLTLTLPEGTNTWTADDGSGTLLAQNGTVYLSADWLKENSDIDLTTAENPHRVIARNKWSGVKTAQVQSDTPVRYRGGPKSRVLTELKAGATVAVTEQLDNWVGVTTDDGFTGYVKKNAVTISESDGIAHTEDTRFVFPKADKPAGKVCMAWQYVGSTDANGQLQQLIQGADGLNTISPTWFAVTDNSGTLRSYADKSYVDAAHAAGLSVWAHFGNVDVQGVSADPAVYFGSSDARANIISQLMQSASDTGFDGINLDFESLGSEKIPQYLQFIRELSVAAHEKNLIVSVDNFVPAYTKYYKRQEQAKAVDYIVIMGYDEHTSSSEEAGPVASISYVKQGIEDTLSEVSKDQVINAVPFYTRGWTESFGNSVPQSKTLGMDEADAFVQEHGIELSFDSDVGENCGTAETEDARYSIWMEDEKALEEKMKLIKEYDLAGCAAWRLGYERSSVWSIIKSYLN